MAPAGLTRLALVAQLLAALATHAAPLRSPSPCATPADCSYNGVCGAAGACACTAPWTGAGCDVLALAPLDNATAQLGYQGRDAGGRISSWGGSVVQGDNGEWHMFAAEMEAHCGINTWLSNSAVVHATSPDPLRVPFTLVAAVDASTLAPDAKVLFEGRGATALAKHLACASALGGEPVEAHASSASRQSTGACAGSGPSSSTGTSPAAATAATANRASRDAGSSSWTRRGGRP